MSSQVEGLIVLLVTSEVEEARGASPGEWWVAGALEVLQGQGQDRQLAGGVLAMDLALGAGRAGDVAALSTMRVLLELMAGLTEPWVGFWLDVLTLQPGSLLLIRDRRGAC